MPRGVPGPVKKTKANIKRPDQIGGGKPGPGRPKGRMNKFSGDLKQAILDGINSAHEHGIAHWVRELAQETPTSAAALIGRLVPLQTEGRVDATITVIYRDETSA
jgi:hypothetical protein